MDFGIDPVVVPTVQELAKDPNLVTVPSRFIRSDQNLTVDLVSDSHHEIPVINFQNLLLSAESYESELAKLHSACKDWGFFQVPFSQSSNYLVIVHVSKHLITSKSYLNQT